MNTFRTTILLAVLFALFMWAGHALGGQQGMIIAFVMASAGSFFSYWFSDKMVIAMYQGQEVTANDDPELYGLVQELTQKANLPMPRVYIIPQETPNAFATGRNPQHAAVAVTEGIRRILTKRELAGVLGHELTHVVNRDILVARSPRPSREPSVTSPTWRSGQQSLVEVVTGTGKVAAGVCLDCWS